MATVAAYILFSNMADRILLSMLGVFVSVYSLYVEVRKEHDPSYVAACDFNEHMSCSKVLTSKYARGFGVVEKYLGKEHPMNTRNCNLGVVFYLLQIVIALCLPLSWSGFLLFCMSVTSLCVSVYLAYILFFVLYDVCVVCIITYVINGLLFYVNYSFYYATTYY